MGGRYGEVVRVIGMCSLLPRVGAVLWVLSSHPGMPLDRGDLLRAVWTASPPGKSALEVDVAMDEVPAVLREAPNIHSRLRNPSSCMGLLCWDPRAEQAPVPGTAAGRQPPCNQQHPARTGNCGYLLR